MLATHMTAPDWVPLMRRATAIVSDSGGVTCHAIRRVWDAGHTNFHVMLPFVRTARELAACRELIGASGLLARPDSSCG